MKFSPVDRMMQLGVVPALTRHVREEFPQASASLWQRAAKAEHRRMVRGCAEPAGDGPFARQAHAAVSLAVLLLAFHESAPEGCEVDVASFGRMVDIALATPIVHMSFSAGDPFAETSTRELERLIATHGMPAAPGRWCGRLRLEGGSAAGDQAIACTVERCGLLPLAVQEKRFYLLEKLCKIEAVQAAACGARLSCASCIAKGDPQCELRCTRG